MILTSELREALQNLDLKSAGKVVDWINISDARTLTSLGFATRGRAGWKITPRGREALLEPAVETGADGSSNVVSLFERPV